MNEVEGKKRFIKDLMNLWGKHLEKGNNPGLLAQFLLETTSDRQSSHILPAVSIMNLIVTEEYDDFLGQIKEFYPNIAPAFQSEDATQFYVDLGRIINETTGGYYTRLLEGGSSV